MQLGPYIQSHLVADGWPARRRNVPARNWYSPSNEPTPWFAQFKRWERVARGGELLDGIIELLRHGLTNVGEGAFSRAGGIKVAWSEDSGA